MRTVIRRLVLGCIGVLSVMILVSVVVYHTSFESLPQDVRADRVLVEKSARRLTLFGDGVPLKTYSVALGRQPQGKKQFQGDGRTPEGLYRIVHHKADSDFRLSIRVDYPNAADVAFAASRGRDPGGDIVIHGIRNGLGFLGPIHRLLDWTRGCVAVTNAEIEEIYRAVPNGTPVEIRP